MWVELREPLRVAEKRWREFLELEGGEEERRRQPEQKRIPPRKMNDYV